MITFLPTPDFAESAAMLDSKRLGNQRVEARMILRWLRNPESYPGHQNAGYTIMWKGYEEALCLYYNACCEEWARRGGQNIVCQPEPVPDKVKLPLWLGDNKMHRTHRSALLYKLPDHYEKYGWANEISDPEVEYLWPRPVEGNDGEYELCPAFWKKKKKQSTANAKKEANKKQPTKKKSSSARQASTVGKQRSNTPSQRKHSSQMPRRSPRLANRHTVVS